MTRRDDDGDRKQKYEMSRKSTPEIFSSHFVFRVAAKLDIEKKSFKWVFHQYFV